MMKLFILSDIHGSGYFCEQAMAQYQAEKADKMLLLGDILYHGPRNDLPQGHEPKKVIRLLNDMAKEILAVRGNCDAEVDGMVLDFPINRDHLLLHENGIPLFATHGHRYSPENPPQMAPGTVLITGHTHVPACRCFESFYYINPGSVSLPKQGSNRGYILFDGKDTFLWKTLTGEEYMRMTVEVKTTPHNSLRAP